ncbi:hypothetical protein ACQUJO_14425 [Ralstonia pseudosolanacearum]
MSHALRWIVWLCTAMAMAIAHSSSQAYGLTPVDEPAKPLADLHKQRGASFLKDTTAHLIEHFSKPVHEAITAEILDKCSGQLKACDTTNVPMGVLMGVRWNDNPVFRASTHSPWCAQAWVRHPYYLDLSSDPLCWATIFYDAERRAASGEHLQNRYMLLYRVHFGDLQFFHSMASWDGEPASVTQRHVLDWLQYLYQIADGEIKALDAPVANVAPGLAAQFGPNGYTTRLLFAPSAGQNADDTYLREMALGVLLHTVEDSFSAAHVERDAATVGSTCIDAQAERSPGVIKAFYAYNSQDEQAHAVQDGIDRAQARLDAVVTVVTVGQRIKRSLDGGDMWEAVRPYFECVYALEKDAPPAGPGPYQAPPTQPGLPIGEGG